MSKIRDFQTKIMGAFSRKSIGGYDPAAYMTGGYGSLYNHRRLNPSQAIDYYNTVSAVAKSVDMIATDIGNLTIVLTDGQRIITSNEALDILRNPNAFQTWPDFLSLYAKYYLVTGNAYFLAIGEIDRPPMDIEIVPPQSVTERTGRLRWPNELVLGSQFGGLRFTLGEDDLRGRYLNGELAGVPVRELTWLVNPDLQNPFGKGASLLNAIQTDLDQLKHAGAHNAALLENGGRLSMVLSSVDEMSERQRARMREQIETSIEGPQNAGRVSFLDGGKFDIKEYGLNQKDMDFIKLVIAAEQRTYTRFGIPLPLISPDRMTFNNFGAAVETYWDDAVEPPANIILSKMTRFVETRVDLNGLSLAFDPNSIAALKERRIREAKGLRETGAVSDNEVRAELGKEPYEGGDTIYKPTTVIPVGQDSVTDDQPIKMLPAPVNDDDLDTPELKAKFIDIVTSDGRCSRAEAEAAWNADAPIDGRVNGHA